MAGRLKIYNDSTSTWEYIGGYGKTMPAGDVVGTSDTQTLTNKTLTSPTVNTPTLVLADSSPTADGSIGFDRTGEDLQIGDGTNSQVVHMGAWTSYNPTLTATTTNPTLGSSTLTGSYSQIGKTVICKVKLTINTTGWNAGSGAYRFSLPVEANNDEGNYGIGVVYDAGTEDFVCRVQTTTTTYCQMLTAKNSTAVTNNLPVATWANGDYIAFTITYEAA